MKTVRRSLQIASLLASLLAASAAAAHRGGHRVDRGITMENASAALDFARDNADGVGGLGWLDYDNDGLLDLFITNGRGHDNGLFHNDGGGAFSEVAAAAGVANGDGNNGVVAGDLDNDGCVDLILTGSGGFALIGQSPLKIYRNQCDGTFSDASASAGILGPESSLAASLGDIDNDGLLDLFVAAVGTAPGLPISVNHHSRLYRNTGNFTFTDISATSGVDTALGACAATFTDYNNDGRTDLLVGNCNEVHFAPTPLQLFRNNGDLTFTDRTAPAGLSRGGFWMGLALADYDHDGDLDIFASNAGTPFAAPHGLYRNNGDGTYTDAGAQAGVAEWEFSWGNGFADFDNDARPDLVFTGSVPPFGVIGAGLANPGRLFFNDGDGTFTAAQSFGLENEFTTGLAVADYDNDGFQDVAILANAYDAAHPGHPVLMHNEGNDNHWITVKTEGTASNRGGVGARVTVRAGNDCFIDEVRAGASQSSSPSPWLTFGLGAARHVKIEVAWPSGLVERFRSVASDQIVTLVEGTGRPD